MGGGDRAVSFDIDGDGDLDLFAVTNYQGTADPGGERNETYRNDGHFKFTPIDSGDLDTAPCGQGATDSDFDGDGDIDVIGANRTGDVNILRNNGGGRFTLAANQLIRNDFAVGNWLKVKLISPRGQAGAFGAKTLVYASDDGRRLLGMRESRSNNGYLSQDDPVLHFGLGHHEFVDVVVTFLSGKTVRRNAVAASQVVTFDERR